MTALEGFRILNYCSYIFEQIGFAVCHQIPTRVISVSGGFLPVCARDTGLYLGFFISFLFLWLTDRGERKNEMPAKGVLVVVFLAVGALAVDGISSYLGFRETTNTIRLITGLMCGFALPLLLFPLFNYQIWRRSSSKLILTGRWEKTVLFFTAILTFVFLQIMQNINIPFGAEVISSLVVISVIFTFVIINLVLITLLPFWYQRANSISQLVIPFLLSFTLSVIELSLSFYVHKYLISLVV